MDKEIFYEYQPGAYGDGILLDEYRNEFSLVAAKRKDGKTYMEWVFPQKKDGSKQPIDKSLPWKIKLGPKDEAIKALRFFLAKLEGGRSDSDDMPVYPTPDDEPPFENGVPF